MIDGWHLFHQELQERVKSVGNFSCLGSVFLFIRAVSDCSNNFLDSMIGNGMWHVKKMVLVISQVVFYNN